MTSCSTSGHPGIVVLGAGGRVGSAVTGALLRRGREVTAVVRDPSRHAFPGHALLRVRQGDARRPGQLSGTLREASGVVLAVTPFTAPPQSFAGFDRDYYAAIISGLDQTAGARRLVCVGLTATAALDDGTRLLDHADLFPPFLAPFADAHLRAAEALLRSTLSWATLIPPAGFGLPPTDGSQAASGYRLLREPVTIADATSVLDHATFAEAVADQITSPAIRRERALVTSDDTTGIASCQQPR